MREAMPVTAANNSLIQIRGHREGSQEAKLLQCRDLQVR